MARSVLVDLTGFKKLPGETLSPQLRFKLALVAVRFGAFQRAARALTWQEFEEFSGKCLEKAGFETQQGVVFKDGTRRWQIDIAALKDRVLLALDCKHWESPNYPSRFGSAVQHQKQSLRPLIRYLRGQSRLPVGEISALPVIVTLFEPRASLLDDVVVVSVEQLPDFVTNLTPYDRELPFVLDHSSAETL
jgi:hypothetical protein